MSFVRFLSEFLSAILDANRLDGRLLYFLGNFLPRVRKDMGVGIHRLGDVGVDSAKTAARVVGVDL